VRTLKRRVSAVIGLVCLAIELGMIYYIKNSSSLLNTGTGSLGLRNMIRLWIRNYMT
jgi:hypothetical protein